MNDQLFETPDNPVPEGATCGIMTARDGCRIRFACFPEQAKPSRGTIVILSGRNECIEKYFETIRDLGRRGFSCVTLDWRGQGGSGRKLRDRKRGYVRSFDLYVSDLKQLFDEIVLPDCRPPYYLLGHSTGSLIALLATPQLSNQVQRMVLVAPLIELSGQRFSMRTLRRLSGFLYYIGLGRLYMRNQAKAGGPSFESNKLTSDDTRFQRNQEIYRVHPELSVGGPTAAWIHAACVASETVQAEAFMARMRIPTLLVAAGADRVVSTAAVEAYGAHMRAGSVLTIDGARHEILQEADRYREQLLAAFDAFIPGSEETED